MPRNFGWVLASVALVALTSTMARSVCAESEEEKKASGPAAAPDQSAIELPWSRPDKISSAVSPVQSMRELLGLYDITAEDLAHFRDDGILTPDEEPLLLRILFRLGQLQPHEYSGWARGDVRWDEILAAPSDARADVFRLQGRVTKVEKREVLPALRASLEFSEFFAVTLQMDEARAVVVFARHVPSAWLDESVRDTPARVDALLLEANMHSDQSPQFIFAAERIAWLPDQAYPQHGVLGAHVLLAQQGVDIGLFEELRKTNGQDLLAEDRELFYQILTAAARQDTSELAAGSYASLNVPQLLINPQPSQGVPHKLVAQARRITKIEVNDPDIQQRFGLDHYFEVDVMLPLGDRPVRLQGQGAKDGPLYEDNYPATFCTTRLPARLAELAAKAASEQGPRGMINERVELAGYFFKVWSYKSEYVSSFDPRQSHLSPLFIGSSVKAASVPPLRGRQTINIIFAVLFVALLAGIGWIAWRGNKRSPRARRGPETLPGLKSLGG